MWSTQSKKRSAVVIEFFGVPGAGKTAICKELIMNLKSRGYKVLDFSSYRSKSTEPSIVRRVRWIFLLLANPCL